MSQSNGSDVKTCLKNRDGEAAQGSAIIATHLIENIKSEQTLNSAAQSVLDKIKRAYDDKFATQYTEREDLTLAVRVFDLNLKSKLIEMEKQSSVQGQPQDSVEFIEKTFDVLEEEIGPDENEATSFDDSSVEEDSDSLRLPVVGSPLKVKSLTEKSDKNRDGSSIRRPSQSLLDENDHVKAYIDLAELDVILNSSAENKKEIDDLCEMLNQIG